MTGLDTLTISEIDPQALAQSFIDSGTVNYNEHWVTGFDPTILQNAQNQAQQKLETYIQNNLNNPTVGDVIGGRKTNVKEYPVLPKKPGQIYFSYIFHKIILSPFFRQVSSVFQ